MGCYVSYTDQSCVTAKQGYNSKIKANNQALQECEKIITAFDSGLYNELNTCGAKLDCAVNGIEMAAPNFGFEHLEDYNNVFDEFSTQMINVYNDAKSLKVKLSSDNEALRTLISQCGDCQKLAWSSDCGKTSNTQ